MFRNDEIKCISETYHYIQSYYPMRLKIFMFVKTSKALYFMLETLASYLLASDLKTNTWNSDHTITCSQLTVKFSKKIFLKSSGAYHLAKKQCRIFG